LKYPTILADVSLTVKMEKILRIRKIVFIAFFVIFIIGAVLVGFYSNGWRFDLKSFSFEKTGAIFVETIPRDVNIKVDGKTFKDKSGPLSSGTLISNLLPETYKIEINKNGFFSWYKNLSVKPTQVSEAINVILIPNNITKDIFFNSQKISDFIIGPKEKLIFKSNSKLYFNEPKDIPTKLKGDVLVEISNDEAKAIVKNSTANTFYLYDLKSPISSTTINTIVAKFDAKMKIKNINFHPFDSKRIIFESDEGLYSLDTDSSKAETIFDANKKPFLWKLIGSKVYFFSAQESGFFNLVFKTKTTLPLPLFDLLKTTKVFTISPDGKKIAFIDQNNKLKIYFLDDQIKGFAQKSGDVIILNLKNSSVIKNISWYFDSLHLFVEYTNEVYFTEIDNREPINSYLIDSGLSKFHYEISTNLLYFLKDGFIYRWQIK